MPDMTRDENGWNQFVANNTDPYGKACVDYATRWADLMEARIASGEALENCAEESSHTADTDGITGFMYGCAVNALAHCWIHGERLRRWHNLKTQFHDEGEKANQNGGVLNPAVLVIGR